MMTTISASIGLRVKFDACRFSIQPPNTSGAVADGWAWTVALRKQKAVAEIAKAAISVRAIAEKALTCLSLIWISAWIVHLRCGVPELGSACDWPKNKKAPR